MLPILWALQAFRAFATLRSLQSRDLQASRPGWQFQAPATTSRKPSTDGQKASKRKRGRAHGSVHKMSNSGAWSEQSVERQWR